MRCNSYSWRISPFALENRFPAAFNDGFKAVQWLAKQANLSKCNKSLLHVPKGYLQNDSDVYISDAHQEILDTFGASLVEPCLAAHGNPSKFFTYIFLSFFCLLLAL